MEMTLTRVESNSICGMCNTRIISGMLVVPESPEDKTPKTHMGCGECLGEKVKEIL